MRIVNVSNAACFAVEIQCPDGVTQLVNIRGGNSLLLGMKPQGSTTWLRTPIDRPERFGFFGPVKSVKEMLMIATSFVKQAQEVYA